MSLTAEATPGVLCPALGPQSNKTLRGWRVSREGAGAPGGAERAGKGISLEKRRLRGDLLALHNSLPRDRNRRKGNGPRLGQGRRRLDIRRNFPIEMWSGLGTAWGCLECPSLEVSKESLDVALSALGWG